MLPVLARSCCPGTTGPQAPELALVWRRVLSSYSGNPNFHAPILGCLFQTRKRLFSLDSKRVRKLSPFWTLSPTRGPRGNLIQSERCGSAWCNAAEHLPPPNCSCSGLSRSARGRRPKHHNSPKARSSFEIFSNAASMLSCVKFSQTFGRTFEGNSQLASFR